MLDNRLQQNRSGLITPNQRDIGLIRLRGRSTGFGNDLRDLFFRQIQRHHGRTADRARNGHGARRGAHARHDNIRLHGLGRQGSQNGLARLVEGLADESNRTGIGNCRRAVRLHDDIERYLLRLRRRKQTIGACFENRDLQRIADTDNDGANTATHAKTAIERGRHIIGNEARTAAVDVDDIKNCGIPAAQLCPGLAGIAKNGASQRTFARYGITSRQNHATQYGANTEQLKSSNY